MELFPSAFTSSYITLASFLTDDYGNLLQIYNYQPSTNQGEGTPFVSENASFQCHRYAANGHVDI